MKNSLSHLDNLLDKVNYAIIKWRLHRELFAGHERRCLELEELGKAFEIELERLQEGNEELALEHAIEYDVPLNCSTCHRFTMFYDC